MFHLLCVTVYVCAYVQCCEQQQQPAQQHQQLVHEGAACCEQEPCGEASCSAQIVITPTLSTAVLPRRGRRQAVYDPKVCACPRVLILMSTSERKHLLTTACPLQLHDLLYNRLVRLSHHLYGLLPQAQKAQKLT